MIKIKKNILIEASNEFGLSFIVLFGSQLFKRKGFKYDYDIAVYLRDPCITTELELRLINFFSQILKSNDIDIVILNSASPLIQYEIAFTGKLLYEKSLGLFDRFKWRAIQNWNDNKKFSQLNLNYLRDYLAEISYGT